MKLSAGVRCTLNGAASAACDALGYALGAIALVFEAGAAYVREHAEVFEARSELNDTGAVEELVGADDDEDDD